MATQLNPTIPLDKLKVWVLAPHVQTQDANLNYYYDFSQSIAEYTAVFTQLHITWQWQPVTMQDYETIIDSIAQERDTQAIYPIVFNLCDGDEVNGTPGISVVKLLAKKQLIYTGADANYYTITTSKINMKRAFDVANVATPKWKAIVQPHQTITELFSQLGKPIIVKPSVAGGSMGIGIKNVVSTFIELETQVHRMFQGYHGWQLTTDGLVAEAFVNGPEYTVFIVGNYNDKANAIIYPPVERVFHASLPENEKFLSFDRLWEIYEDENPMPNGANFYEYAVPETSLHEALKQLAWDAYVAVQGSGYSRVDIRMDKATGALYVLEANAQCGISEDENYTSIGAILKFANTSFTELVVQIINNSIYR